MEQDNKLKIIQAKRQAQEQAEAKLQQRHDEILEVLGKAVEKLSKLPEELKPADVKLDSLEIKNLDVLETKLDEVISKLNTQPDIKIENKQDLTKINKSVATVEKAFRDVLKLVSELKRKQPEVIVNNDIDWPTNPSEAIPVVLVDRERKRFYDALQRVVAGGGGGFPSRLTSDDAVKVVNPDGSNIGGGGSIDISTLAKESKQDDIITAIENIAIDPPAVTNYTTRIAEDSEDTNLTYIGNAELGADESAAVWQIKRLDSTTGLVKLWANGSDAFNVAWTNRENEEYL